MKDLGILIVGATSDIARAVACGAAAEGTRVYLAARNVEEAAYLAQDLRVRYQTTVASGGFEAEAYDTHEQLVRAAEEALGRLDGVVVSIGILGEQSRAQRETEHLQRIVHSNYTGAASLLTHAANHLEAQGSGFIAGIASVAGDRGRQSNYVYGSAKGAFSLFLQGLRNRLAGKGVHVMTVKPGFVDTRMTFGLPGLFLVATPERVAADILKGIARRRNEIYTPWFWRWIMMIIRHVPEFIFKKLKL